MPNLKFIPENIDQVREALIDFPADLEIELEIGVPLDTKTVEDLRLLSTWPHRLSAPDHSKALPARKHGP
jgi:hypothetical protein